MGLSDLFKVQGLKLLSTRSIHKLPTEDLAAAREEYRIANLMADDPRLQRKMRQIDSEIGRRMPEPPATNAQPRHTEHGWYLSEGD